MLIITIYNDLTDKILARFYFPDNEEILREYAMNFKKLHNNDNIYFGVKNSENCKLH